jgi:amino acid adenylation domain-containing protein
MDRTRRLEDLLSASTLTHPDRTAVVDPGVATIRYRDLECEAGRIAERLRELGVAPGDRVGLHAPKSIGIVASLFGIMKAGAAYVPVDPSAPARRSLQILTDCTVRALITDEPRAEALRRESGQEWKVLAELDGLRQWTTGLVVLEGPSNGTTQDPPASLAYILYTSGSTGKPKGVMHTHSSALSFVDWCSREFAPTAEDVFSSHAPFHFDLSILDLYVPIQHGAALVLIGEELGKQPQNLARLISEERLTVWYSTPSILRLLLEYGRLDRNDCSSLRLVHFAGEVFPLKHLGALRNVWRHPRYYNLYGPTETNVCTFYEVPSELPSDTSETLPIGSACSDDQLRIVNAQGVDVPQGEEGELLVSGGSVMTGYWNRAELTNQAFSIDSVGRRWYRTGDVVVDDGDGVLRFLGRRDRMVKRRGFRVELGEIESALYRHPNVTEAATVASPDPESGVLIKAFLSWSGETAPSLVELKQFCASNLPLYMVPDRFKVLAELPKTSTDKIDYRSLAELD